jgi:cystathionine beta-lyase
VGSFGLVASTAAFTHGRDWLADVLTRLDRNRALLAETMADQAPEVVMGPVEGSYLAWLDFSAYPIDDPADFLLDRARVALSAGEPFRGDSSRFARLNFATDEVTLVAIVERIGEAVGRAKFSTDE